MAETDQKVYKLNNAMAYYKKLLDDDIRTYSKYIKQSTLENYGDNSLVATDVYLDILSRGGKRLRGGLVITGYEMCGGEDQRMIIQAARAIEMIHAYLLIIDDITDRSDTRRGKPSAHKLLSNYYVDNKLGKDAEHFGESVAMTSALLGNHAAQMIMANLDVREDFRLNALSILNRGMIITINGQFNDVFNQYNHQVAESDVDNVTKWKSAHYTFLNSLHIGMILAGADCHSTDAITEYAMQTGEAFQIRDDILGIFGDETRLGKSTLDDIQEGKRTLLVVYALDHTNDEDKKFLMSMLGNQKITRADFLRCQDIIKSSGALDYAQQKAQRCIQAALKSLDQESKRWRVENVDFLRELSLSLNDRTS